MKAFVSGCILLIVGVLMGGFLGVSGTVGPLARRQLFLFVDPYGQVQPSVTPNTQVHWTKLGGDDGRTIVPVQDIKFKGLAPCKEGDPLEGVCTINVMGGWHAYDCPDSCDDPTMPVGSRTKTGGGGGSSGGGPGSKTGSVQYLPGSPQNLAAAFVMPSPEPGEKRRPLGDRVKLAYLDFAGGFDDVLRGIWNNADLPVPPDFPLPLKHDKPSTFLSGPVARESVVCASDGSVSVPAGRVYYSGGAKAIEPGVSVVWDSAGDIGEDWLIQDAAVPGPGLKDVCEKTPPYNARAETAGACRLKASAAGSATASSAQYQVVVKSGRCASATPHPVTLSIEYPGIPKR